MWAGSPSEAASAAAAFAQAQHALGDDALTGREAGENFHAAFLAIADFDLHVPEGYLRPALAILARLDLDPRFDTSSSVRCQELFERFRFVNSIGTDIAHFGSDIIGIWSPSAG